MLQIPKPSPNKEAKGHAHCPQSLKVPQHINADPNPTLIFESQPLNRPPPPTLNHHDLNPSPNPNRSHNRNPNPNLNASPNPSATLSNRNNNPTHSPQSLTVSRRIN